MRRSIARVLTILSMVGISGFLPEGTFAETPLTSDKVFIGKPEATGNEVPEAENLKLRAAKTDAQKSAELSARIAAPVTGSRFLRRADGVYCANSQTRLLLEGDDNLSGLLQIRYRLNDGKWQDYRGFVLVAEEGKYSLKWESLDRVGNRENQQSLRLLVDNTPPKLTVSPQGSYVIWKTAVVARPGFKISAHAKDARCGLQGIYVSTGGAWRQLEEESLQFNEPGKYALQILADDILDNRTEIRTFSLIIDDEAPTIKLHPTQAPYQEGAELVCRPGTEILVGASDYDSEVKKIEIRRSASGEWATHDGQPVEIYEPGEFYLEARATDIAGNTNKETAQFRCRSPVPPPKTILTPKEGKK